MSSQGATIPCLGSSDDVQEPFHPYIQATKPRSRRIAHSVKGRQKKKVRTIPDPWDLSPGDVYGSVRSVEVLIPTPPAPESSDTHIAGKSGEISQLVDCVCMGTGIQNTHILSTS